MSNGPVPKRGDVRGLTPVDALEVLKANRVLGSARGVECAALDIKPKQPLRDKSGREIERR